MTDMTEVSVAEKQEAEQPMTGTPITRSGGYLIRVGWRAVGYSVDRETEGRYRRARGFLFILALMVGVGTALGADYVLNTFITSKVGQYVPLIKNSPELMRLVIYGLTLVVGGLIYLQILASVGKGMVKGKAPFDNGFSLMEQRRRSAKTRKRELLFLLLVVAGIFLVPVEWALSLKLFVAGIISYFVVEGLFFKVTGGQ